MNVNVFIKDTNVKWKKKRRKVMCVGDGCVFYIYSFSSLVPLGLHIRHFVVCGMMKLFSPRLFAQLIHAQQNGVDHMARDWLCCTDKRFYRLQERRGEAEKQNQMRNKTKYTIIMYFSIYTHIVLLLRYNLMSNIGNVNILMSDIFVWDLFASRCKG